MRVHRDIRLHVYKKARLGTRLGTKQEPRADLGLSRAAEPLAAAGGVCWMPGQQRGRSPFPASSEERLCSGRSRAAGRAGGGCPPQPRPPGPPQRARSGVVTAAPRPRGKGRGRSCRGTGSSLLRAHFVLLASGGSFSAGQGMTVHDGRAAHYPAPIEASFHSHANSLAESFVSSLYFI